VCPTVLTGCCNPAIYALVKKGRQFACSCLWALKEQIARWTVRLPIVSAFGCVQRKGLPDVRIEVLRPERDHDELRRLQIVTHNAARSGPQNAWAGRRQIEDTPPRRFSADRNQTGSTASGPDRRP